MNNALNILAKGASGGSYTPTQNISYPALRYDLIYQLGCVE